jgi:thiol-disulfide isomerase/thioredoxin
MMSNIGKARGFGCSVTRLFANNHAPASTMKLLNLRIALLVAFCGVAALSVLWFPTGHDSVMAIEAEPKQESELLTIGSKAPALDIEHWIQDGNGFFKPVTTFKPGNVYVVEFWATWCPPCVASMPHLAELQDKLRGQNVQIVSISDEPLETVTEFLKRKTQNKAGEETTFASITASYSLTTDPDRSAHEDYMEAARQNGIPTSFIVGKDGKIEWIGHPMELDQPLEMIVADKWDRNEFAESFVAEQRLGDTMAKLSQLANQGQFADAIKLLDTELARKLPERVEKQLVGVKYQIKLMGGMIDDDVTGFIRNRIASVKGNAIGVAQISMQVMRIADQNPSLAAQPAMKGLLSDMAKSLAVEIDGAEKQVQPFLFDMVARMHQATGNLDAAIESQEAAIAIADEQTKQRMESFLEELKAAKSAATADGESK